MRPNRGRRRTRAWIALAALVLAAGIAFAACGDDEGDDGAASSGGAETVSVESIGDAGDVLVDPNGAALYSPDEEANGKIQCTGECTSIWVPLTVKSGQTPTGASEVDADLGTVKRPEGTTQVTFQGAPLYTFSQEGAGEVTGDGFADSFGGQDFTWHVITPSGASSGSSGGSSTSDSSQGGGGYGY